MGAGALLGLVLSAVWSVAVWAFFGGAITRGVAVQLASGERVGWGASLRWAGSRWLSYFGAPFSRCLGILLAVVPLAIVGLIMRLGGIGLLLAGVCWPLALVGGLIIALLLLGLIFGWPLMWATISARDRHLRRPEPLLCLRLPTAFAVLRYALFAGLSAGSAGSWSRTSPPRSSGSPFGRQLGGGGHRMADSAGLKGRAGTGGGARTHWSWLIKWLAVGYVYGYFGRPRPRSILLLAAT